MTLFLVLVVAPPSLAQSDRHSVGVFALMFVATSLGLIASYSSTSSFSHRSVKFLPHPAPVPTFIVTLLIVLVFHSDVAAGWFGSEIVNSWPNFSAAANLELLFPSDVGSFFRDIYDTNILYHDREFSSILPLVSADSSPQQSQIWPFSHIWPQNATIANGSSNLEKVFQAFASEGKQGSKSSVSMIHPGKKYKSTKFDDNGTFKE